VATPSIRGNPIAEHAGGNAGVVSSQDNVGKSENPAQINRQDKNAMKSVMRTIVRVVNSNKRNWVDTLRPKVRNQAITATRTLWRMDKRFSAHRWLLRRS